MTNHYLWHTASTARFIGLLGDVCPSTKRGRRT